MKILLFIICCSFLSDLNAQKQLSPEIEELCAKLKTSDVIYGNRVGPGIKPKIFKVFEQLVQKASINELKILIRDKSVIVKGYAFWALRYRNKEEAHDALKKFKFSFRKVNLLLYGCMGDRCSLKDFVHFIYLQSDEQLQLFFE